MSSTKRVEVAKKLLTELEELRKTIDETGFNPPANEDEEDEFYVLAYEIGKIEKKLNKRLDLTMEGLPLGYADELENEIEQVGERGFTPENLGELKADMLWYVDKVIAEVNKIVLKGPIKDVGNVMRTEKEFLSEKVPQDVAENIASFLTGKKGAIQAQKSQLATEVGKPGVPARGGRKTKKNHVKRRKTYRRCV